MQCGCLVFFVQFYYITLQFQARVRGQATGYLDSIPAFTDCGHINESEPLVIEPGQKIIIRTPIIAEGLYPPNCLCDWSFIPSTSAVSVMAKFTAFDLETNYDYLYVFSGDDVAPIASYTGDRRPGDDAGVFGSQGNNFTLRFKSDQVINNRGFVAEVKVSAATNGQAPASGSGAPIYPFICSSGLEYIPAYKVCDGYEDCKDGSDETDFADCGSQFTCSDGRRVSNYYVCDGVKDCADGSDEDNEMACGEQWFWCDDTVSIPDIWRCDGIPDCPDGLDEGSFAKCSQDLCEGYCLNDAYCVEMKLNNGHVVPNCYCGYGWTGLRCETDDDDNCLDANCTTNAICVDLVDDYKCVCHPGFTGHFCNETTTNPPNNILFTTYVSPSGNDIPNCGQEDTKCKTIGYAISRTIRSGTLILSANPQGYNITKEFIARSMTFKGENGTSAQSIFINITDTRVGNITESSPIFVEFVGVTITGNMSFGEGMLKLRNSEFNNFILYQSTVIQHDLGEFKLAIEGCTFDNSFLGNTPGQLRMIDNSVFRNLRQMGIQISLSNFTNSNMNFTVQGLDAVLRQSSLSASEYVSSAVHIQVGSLLHIYEEVTNQVDSEDSEKKEEYKSSLLVEDCTVTGLSGKLNSEEAAFHILSEKDFRVEILDTEFTGNSRALSIYNSNGTAKYNIHDNSFNHNLAYGPGGAIYLATGDATTLSTVFNCNFTGNMAMSLSGVSTPENESSSDILEISRITGSGGAIGVALLGSNGGAKSSIDILNSTFLHNTAENYGGSIYLTPGVKATISSNYFNNIAIGVRPRVGDVLESRGDISLDNNIFDVSSASNDVSIISYRADRDGSFMQLSSIEFICPSGYEVNQLLSSIKTSSSRIPIETMIMSCISCEDGTYTIDRDHVTLNQDKLEKHSNTSCKTCEYGSSCQINQPVFARANYWGEIVHGDKIYMYLCPDNYCCQLSVCDSLNSCADNRDGILCGECADGYSESLFTNSCIRNEECTYATWFWAVIGLYGILYVLLFVYQEEIEHHVRKFATFVIASFKSSSLSKRLASSQQNTPSVEQRDKRVNSNTDDLKEDDGEEEEEEGAFLSIFMYYIQVSGLITLKILYENDRDTPIEAAANAIKSIFSFNTWGIDLNTCMFQGTNPVHKAFFQIGFILFLFVAWFLILLVFAPVTHIGRRKMWMPSWPIDISIHARFAGTFVNIMLYTYQYFAENAFTLIKCVTIKSLGVSVLFIDGHLTCYQDWQMMVIGFICIYVVPFFLVLTYGPSLLFRRIISTKIFILSLVFPLILFPIFIYLFRKHSTKAFEEYKTVHASKSGEQKDGTVEIVVGIVFKPFKNNIMGGFCWEGVIALRRLLLVIAVTMVANVLVRHILIVVLCFFALMTHIKFQPYVKPLCNTVETVSLVVLLLISMMSLLKASYYESGIIPRGSADKVLGIYDWVEAVLLGLIPILVITLCIVAVLLSGFVFVYRKCSNSSRLGETNELSTPHNRLSDIASEARVANHGGPKVNIIGSEQGPVSREPVEAIRTGERRVDPRMYIDSNPNSHRVYMAQHPVVLAYNPQIRPQWYGYDTSAYYPRYS